VDGWRVPGFIELRELGAGAQGRAVLVREEASGRVAVLKYLGAGAQSAAREMFRRESVLLKRVQSPHVAGWYGHFEDAAGSAILMEAVDGVSLKDALGRYGTLTPEAALVVLKGSLLGLAAAHAVGVVHRDYKPANVVVQGDGCSKLIDFGVAVYAGEGSRTGTPAYMAPEQWRGEPATPATDVYAATCVFFECVTGRRPYGESDPVALMGRHVTAPVPSEAVPEPLRALVERGMAKSGTDRPKGAAAFAAELETAATGAYGPDWEQRGVAALSTAAAALAALFPIAALLAPGSAGAASAAGVVGQAAGLAAKLGSAAKVALAVAGATAVATVGGAVVYNAVTAQPHNKHQVAAVPTRLQAQPVASGVPSLPAIQRVMAQTVELANATEHFVNDGGPKTVPDGHGGTLTAAIGQRYPTADGHGQLIFFWHGTHFLGWDAPQESTSITHLAPAGAGAFRVSYLRYAPNDAECCPSLPPVTLDYHWTGQAFTASGTPPQHGQPVRVRLLP
jgi:hypothetical protein